MFVRSLFAISILASAACSDDSGGGTPDAPRADAQTSRVMEVTCPATTPVTFTTLEMRFEPQTAAITMGQIVKIESTNSEHPIIPIPNDPLSDPDLRVPGGETKCFTFLAKRMFKFQCMKHGYAGTLTVN
jgi:plastocyanin